MHIRTCNLFRQPRTDHHKKMRLTLSTTSIVQIARGATLVKLGEHSTLDERNIIMRNVELCKSGPNIASHA